VHAPKIIGRGPSKKDPFASKSFVGGFNKDLNNILNPPEAAPPRQ
jgi:hypothetical protein